MSASTIRPLCSVLLVLFAGGCARQTPPAKPATGVIYTPHPNAVWPWPNETEEDVHRGVHRWFTDTTEDGTTLDLLRFDFIENPKLRFELYDQDEDDAQPFDDSVDYYGNGVGAVARHLNTSGRDRLVAAWNGLFFAYGTPGGGPGVTAHHVGPVVLGGKGRYNVGNHRWTFGVSYRESRPTFDALFLPSLKESEDEFEFAASGAQLLVRAGKPMQIRSGPDSEESAGAIAVVDDMRTSRVSMAWSKDSRYLYLLFVNEPDTETASKLQVRHGETPTGGFALRDLQRFWIAFGAWGAINSDGGAVAQMVYRRGDGKYEMLPPRLVAGNQRLVFDDKFEGAPEGGTLMTFFVTERP